MAFDFDKTLDSMLKAAKRSFGRDWPKAERLMKQALADRKVAMKRLAAARLNGTIDDDTFQRRLERSRLVLEAAFRASVAITKAAAQKAVNQALKVLQDAVLAALP